MKEERYEKSTDSESSLTLSDRFHPYKKPDSSSPPPRYISHRRVERSLMNNQRVFATAIDGTSSPTFESIESSLKKATHHTNILSSSSTDPKDRNTEPSIRVEEDLSKDINLVREEDFQFLESVDFSDCLDLEMYDFDQSFSINKAASLDDVASSIQSLESLKPKCKEPSIEWSDPGNFVPIIPTSPTNKHNNREVSTLELLLEEPLKKLLYHNVNNLDNWNKD